MLTYNIGIDFGTSQTKICTTNIFDNPLDRKFVFHKFSAGGNNLLPSTIKLNDDGTCVMGLNEPDVLRYFKMQALYDDSPLYKIQNLHAIANPMTRGQLANYPEICCILYLAYCILDVKETFNASIKVPTRIPIETSEKKDVSEVKPKQNLFARLFGKRQNEPITNLQQSSIKSTVEAPKPTYFYTIGIPTEYDFTKENQRRRSKQYEMLYLAVQLADDLKDLKSFEGTKIQELLSLIETHYEKIKNSDELPQTFYKQSGLYVVAETTAGIIPLHDRLQRELDAISSNDLATQNFRINNLGNYITMDVGAGTTDVSFFNLSNDSGQIRMRYYASKSIPEASNFLIFRYLKSNNSEDITNFEFDKIDDEQWTAAQKDFRKHLFNVIRDPHTNLYYRVSRVFNHKPRQYWHYEFSIAKGCKVYGGGSRFDEFNRGELLLHNGGVKLEGNHSTYTNLQKFITPGEFNFNVAFPNGRILEKDSKEYNSIVSQLDVLNTALGLAMVNFNNRPDCWIDVVSLPDDPNPPEDGMAMYDVFNRDWIV